MRVQVRTNVPQSCQEFRKRRIDLTPGGRFVFDGVGENGHVVVTVSTNGARTAGGTHGSGNLQNIRADSPFPSLSTAKEPVLMFSEPDMFDLCRKKADHGRLPRGVGFDLAEIPVELRQRLQEA